MNVTNVLAMECIIVRYFENPWSGEIPLKKIIIDTDTASDDAVAIVMALREPQLKVLAITTVVGNIPVKTATRNALICIEAAGTYAPPVYEGIAKPMFREHRDATSIHGNDGMGDLGTLKEPTLKIEKMHAVDAIIKIVREGDGDIEIVALGTLTNVALAIVKAPEVMKKVPCITIMGGAAFEGNSNPLAEYNIWQDAEAADILFASGIPVVMAAIEACHDESEFSAQDLEYLRTCGSKLATFCVDINRGLIACDEAYFGHPALTLPDPTAIAILVKPELIKGSFDCYTRVETTGSEQVYGATINDRRTEATHPFRADNNEKIGDFNCKVVYQLHGQAFKDYVFSLIVDKSGSN
jgi:purine nucleosidase